MAFLEESRRRWRSYTGDRDLELAIRAKLRGRGLLGQRATILDARLIAVQRPGWLQLYSFTVDANDPDGRDHRLYGLARLDERSRSEIELFAGESDRDLQAREWSRGLVVAHRRQRSALEWALIFGFVAALGLAVASALLSSS